MSEDVFNKLPAYWWVDSLAGQSILHMAVTFGLLESIYDQFFSRWGLSQTKANVLLLLYKNKSMAFWELGKDMLVTRSNITGLMDRLEKDKLVSREVNPADRRSLTAKLTAKGKKIVEEIIPLLKDFTEEVMSPLSEAEKEVLIKLLQKFPQIKK
jgi:MarR family 2-MHQ and catechol resistance regulon transcriptional repressor